MLNCLRAINKNAATAAEQWRRFENNQGLLFYKRLIVNTRFSNELKYVSAGLQAFD